ncbi:MAG: peptidoglycan-binding protein, partial [Clostridium sp.]|nr:peptidoglycan-binding protein [Clostridium sp.]MBE6051917.1 peptidoglycan-binding protein [Clostridium sp.]
RLGLTPDGIFGNQSYQGTVEFQRAHGLDQDGIVGFNTLKTMALC